MKTLTPKKSYCQNNKFNSRNARQGPVNFQIRKPCLLFFTIPGNFCQKLSLVETVSFQKQKLDIQVEWQKPTNFQLRW